jgi:transketolase
VGLNDTYAESGGPEELFEKYGLTSKHIVQAAEKAISHKPRR